MYDIIGQARWERGVKPVHGSTVQRFCREEPPRITRLFHPGQGVPYAFKIISDELIAKIIHNRTYEIILQERHQHEFEARGGIFEAEIIDDSYAASPQPDPQPREPDKAVHEEQPRYEKVHNEDSVRESHGESSVHEDAKNALINVDGIRTQFLEKMDKMELQISDLSRENGILTEANRNLEQRYTENQKLLQEAQSNISDQQITIEKQGGALTREKNKGLITAISFLAAFFITLTIGWNQITILDKDLSSEKAVIANKDTKIDELQTSIKITRDSLEQEQKSNKDLEAAWKINFDHQRNQIKKLEEQLSKEDRQNASLKEQIAELKKKLEETQIPSSEEEPSPTLFRDRN